MAKSRGGNSGGSSAPAAPDPRENYSNTNPLASYGYSDYDYATAAAALASEALNQGVRGMALVADVGRNRWEDSQNRKGAFGAYGEKGPADWRYLHGQVPRSPV
jgi:spore germination cell wall hydrolase CwlJ-like protein